MKKTGLFAVLTLLTAFLATGVFVFAISVTDYKPEPVTEAGIQQAQQKSIDNDTLNFMLWNIGYAGLDASMDFFYDGGVQVRPSEKQVQANMENILFRVNGFKDSVDFFLFQEVDKVSKRSYFTNQFDLLMENLKNFEAGFGKNYDVRFVPLPLKAPMGRVKSGVAVFSKYGAERSLRYSFEGNYSWPLGIFMLDRCFLLSRYSLNDTSELVLINTHNSAYDDGNLRSTQLEQLAIVLRDEYARGNYVIAGGDWNMTPAGFSPKYDQPFDTANLTYLPDNYFSNWHWTNSDNAPTNRRVKTAYRPGVTATTTIDFFLLSPNIEALNIKTVDLNFACSDHQPVYLKAKLN